MRLKDQERFEKEWWQISPYLRKILCDFEVWAKEHGQEITITSLIRTDEEQQALFEAGLTPDKTSVHQFGRGADVRRFDNDTLDLLAVDYINGKYKYDPARPTMSTMSDEGQPAHFHIKVLT